MRELTVEATIEQVHPVTDFVNEQLEELNCPAKAQIQIDIAIDELFSNIAYYAYGTEVGQATVRVEYQASPPAAVISFIDSGIPYNPLEQEDPDLTQSSEERPVGGLGIYMVKKSMDEVSYQYKDGQNILTIKKLF